MIFVKIGVVLLMLSVGVEVVKSILKNNHGAQFLMQLGAIIFVILGIASIDLVYSSFFTQGWLFFPSMINTLLKESEIPLVYSDKLNVELNMIGISIILIILYIIARNKGITTDKKRIKLVELDNKVPIYVDKKTFNYSFFWIGLTTLLVSFSYYSYIFDLGRTDKRILIPLMIVCGIVELLLTVTQYIFLKELKQIGFMILLFKDKEKYSDIVTKIDKLLTNSTVYVQGKEIDNLLKTCVDMNVFDVIGTEKIRDIKLNDTVQIKLTELAKKFFSNQEELLSKGVVICEEGVDLYSLEE
ncbi:hypothetical protein FNP24_001148 [Enterococcus faecalis]|uniref:hypothetical protein n=1 Tax=Enterococcus faecalis TaxID=1351 RepID=UPI000CF0C63C|nr:hypothetical protein [Enterococcus faecalis]EGO5093238.1 hypothetical protein [Enterococcus faecalis]EGO6583792.1 hypothetical protein [Enterococcus faecalis]EGO7727763.1 hypothetical protein [Enterococcus faecalis]EGO8153828.1 hypothetical protein [Enterococcus faecalis]EGS8050135.1 hypothetical protein [Enterococcus faecalis]